jgi:hypothetical protein
MRKGTTLDVLRALNRWNIWNALEVLGSPLNRTLNLELLNA